MTSTASEPQLGLGPAGRLLASGLAQRWWLVLLRGIAAIAFGALAFLWPHLTLISLALVWGTYAFIDGIASLGLALSVRDGGAAQRWWLALVGVIGVLAGVAAFFAPLLVAKLLLLYIAFWAILIGVLQIWGAVRLRREITGEWMLILTGLLAVAFGALVIARPVAGALSIVWLIAAYAIVAGVTYIGLAFRMRSLKSAV
jgi:uncharacterized membrane protein HdeD (DUF308 family)